LPRGKLLDAPAGHGALSASALALGFSVTACDLSPEQFEVPGLQCDKVDLHGQLPYADDEFDAVVCVEAIEHVENPFHLLRELRRVLRPGGRLILTTPNVLSLPSRLRVLFTGLAAYFDFDSQLAYGHIMPVSLPQLHTALDFTGFQLRTVAGNRVKRGARALAPLAPAVRLITRRKVARPVLRDLLLSDAALYSEIIILTAE
jgi:SAM-dependent methyltransferase